VLLDKRHRFLSYVLLVALAGGCVSPTPSTPAYTWIDSQSAVKTLCQRSSSVHTVSSECALTLTRDNGESVRLDGAIAMKLPDSVRMRAWKMGQAVFDLTVTPAGLWIESPPDPDRRGQILPATLSAAKLARAWSIVSGEFFCSADLVVVDSGGPCFLVERNIEGQHIVCQIDRASLTPERYSVIDADGVERFALSLDRYQIVNGIVWPMRMIGRSQGSRIMIELKDTELNGELAPNAFVPPRNAERVQ
jgi:hypothetical protein